MYLRITTNSTGQAYYHIVESYRVKGKVRQRRLLSLGRVEENKLENLAQALDRHRTKIEVIDFAKDVSVEETFILGPIPILKTLFEKLGIKQSLDGVAEKHPKLGFDFTMAVFTLVVLRFIKPGSKLKVFEHWLKKLYPEMVSSNVELHQFYRALDLLAAHKDEIEQQLYWHERDLFNMEIDVVLYDLTTLRFESVREDLGKLRRFGYSKEKRSDCTQVVFGLLVDTEGIPLGFEVYPGNTFEGDTLKDIVEKMRKKFRVRRFIFVADRGLFSAKNLQHIRGEDPKDPGEFIVGMKLGVFKKRHEEFYDLSRFAWLSEELALYETTHEGDRCIITWSKVRAERDRKTREDILAKIRKKLATKSVTPKTFVSNTNYQKYVTGLSDGEKPCLNEKAIAKESARDGFFGVVTNIKDFTAQTLVAQYKELWRIEDAFGEFKGTLRARPVFHWTDDRIIGHLTMCFLAYLCEAHLTKKLREKNKILKSPAISQKIIKARPLTVIEAMKELSEVRAIPVSIKNKKIWVRTDIEGNAAQLYLAAGATIPPKILNLDQSVVQQTMTQYVKSLNS